MISTIHHGVPGSPWLSSALIVAALLYLCGGMRLRRHGQNFEGLRAGSFLLGISFIWLATASPLAALDHELLTAHMIQHLLLMTLAPPLILLGLPRRRPARGFRHLVAHPALCWLAAAGTLLLWHIPSAFMLGMRSPVWHALEQASFLATGLLFWWPVIRLRPDNAKWPEPSLLLYLFLATLPCDILSGLLVFCDRVVYPVFLSSPRLFGLSALEDQQCAGALMWTCVTIVYVIAGAVFAARWLSPHPSVNRCEDLSRPQFGSRGVAAGHSKPHRLRAV